MRWTAVLLTCCDERNSYAYQKELEARQRKGLIHEDTILLTVEDPAVGVGSGGATINALTVITEHLTALAGHTVVNSNVLSDARILILHVGRPYAFSACGRAFLPIPSSVGLFQAESVTTVIDHLIDLLTCQIAVNAPPGVWVCSTDMLINIPAGFAIDWEGCRHADVVVLSVPGTVADARHHGIYITETSQNIVKDILYKKPAEELQSHVNDKGLVDLVVGVVYFNRRVTEKIVSFHTLEPLNSCTYVGVDSGAEAIEVSLFFDLIYAMCCKTKPQAPIRALQSPSMYKLKWKLLHNTLANLTVKMVSVSGGEFHYLFNEGVFLEKAMNAMSAKLPHQNEESTRRDIMNSVVSPRITLPSRCCIINSRIEPPFTLGENAYLSGVCFEREQDSEPLVINSRVVVQHMRMILTDDYGFGAKVAVLFGLDDRLDCPMLNVAATFCNQSWKSFFDRTGCSATDLWSATVSEEKRTLSNAQLYPVLVLGSHLGPADLLWMQDGATVCTKMLQRWRRSWRLSLEDILQRVDLEAEFSWRLELFCQIAEQTVRTTLLQHGDRDLCLLYKAICADQPEECHKILHVLDKVAAETESAGVAARALANIADVLGCMAANRGGLRSGPSGNVNWQAAYCLLEKGLIKDGVAALSCARQQWMRRSDQLIRAARHYEGAAQILIRHAVMTARQFISLTPGCELPPIGRWIVGESPARIDMSGGWSDTPPISYEHGGAVINAAIRVDGKKPIGCKARRLTEPHLVMVLVSGADSTTLRVTELKELADYNHPQSPGALLKAAFCCAEIVQLGSSLTLREQLLSNYGGGFELVTWSDLPHGSGLGTSSILAGAVMAVLWRASGHGFNEESLIHAVLHLEQMLTTGGGWQDQVGGLLPGIKLGYSAATLPLYVQYRTLEVGSETIARFNERLLLVYTGKTRLARNLLQNVVRNWYARDPHIVQTEDNLVSLAHRCTKAFEDGDLKEVGSCWTEYWEMKKRMATGCEPEIVGLMINALKDHVFGSCMAGAGGGGFLYVLTREPNSKRMVETVLKDLKTTEECTVHEAVVDMEGLTLKEIDDIV